MPLRIITPPAIEPVTLAELKKHLRITHDDEDAILRTYLQAARMYAETTLCWRAFIEQELELTKDYFPSVFSLPRPPLQSVTSITYRTRDGTVETIDPADYIVDTDSEPARIVPAVDERWPSDALYPVNAVRVRYTAGYPLEDVEVEDEAVGTGDASETEFSLDNPYIVSGSETIYFDGAVVAAADYTLDDDTGAITFAAAPGQDVVITADYTYQDYRYNVPTEIKQGILILAAHFYEVREPVVIGTSVMVVPMTAEALLLPYRVWGGDVG